MGTAKAPGTKVAKADVGMSLNSFGLSLEGLRRQDAESLAALLNAAPAGAGQMWEITSTGCQALVVDPEAERLSEVLRERPFGAPIIWVLRPGEVAWPGTLSLVRPFDDAQVRLTLQIAAQIAMQPEVVRDAAAGAEQAAFDEDQIPEGEVAGGIVTFDNDAGTGADAPRLFDPAIDPEFDDAVLLEVPGEPDGVLLDESAEWAAFDVSVLDAPETPAAPTADERVETPGPPDELVRDPVLEVLLEEVEETSDSTTLLTPATAAMELAVASPWDTRELTLAEALAELTPTSVPPVDWMDTLLSVGAPAPGTHHQAALDANESRGAAPADSVGEGLQAGAAAAAEREGAAQIDAPPQIDEASQIDEAPHVEEEAPVEEPAEVVSATPERPHRIVAPRETNKGQAVEIESLAGLAAAYREQLYREREVIVQVEDLSFHLLPYQGLCVSDVHPEQLERYRGRQPLGIDIDVVVTEPDERLGESSSLVYFLWHLGVNAGGGTLLPWIPLDRPCRLTRWPPIEKQDERHQLFRVAAILSRTPTTIAEVLELAEAPEAEMNDFLNGCSLLGYLEILPAPTSRAARGGAPAAGAHAGSPDPPSRSLVGRLRQRIGLQQ